MLYPSYQLGSYLYPRSFTGLVHRLPFGLYAKECARSLRNETEALRLLEKYTSIPAPLWVDDYQRTHPILIMTAVPGQTLDKVFHRLSYSEREQLSKDLKSVVSQLRCIPNQTQYIFGNSHGGPLRNHRFPSGTCGPFNSIFGFQCLPCPFLRASRDKGENLRHSRAYLPIYLHPCGLAPEQHYY